MCKSNLQWNDEKSLETVPDVRSSEFMIFLIYCFRKLYSIEFYIV